METVKQSGPWGSLGNHGFYAFTLVDWLYTSGGQSGQKSNFDFLS